MEDKLSKGGNYKKIKKGSKPEYGNSGPENFVHPTFKLSGSAPDPQHSGERYRTNGPLVLSSKQAAPAVCSQNIAIRSVLECMGGGRLSYLTDRPTDWLSD